MEVVRVVLIYQETSNKKSPEEGWDLWGERRTSKEKVFVWKKEVSEEEAQEFYDKQMIEEMDLLT